MSWPNLREPDRPRSWIARVAWLVAIWAASVATLGLVATIIGWAIK